MNVLAIINQWTVMPATAKKSPTYGGNGPPEAAREFFTPHEEPAGIEIIRGSRKTVSNTGMIRNRPPDPMFLTWFQRRAIA
jgi:hypothetical protein